MMVILFRPFDLGKWFTIGFSAFLAAMITGGNGFSFNPSSNNSIGQNHFSSTYSSNINHIHSQITTALTALVSGMTIVLGLFIFAIVLAFMALFYWLGSRGQFMFLDNVVRNRAALAWPWTAYTRQANSLLGFVWLYILVVFAAVLCFTIPAIFALLPLIRAHRWPEGMEIPFFVVFGLLYCAVLFSISIAYFLFCELGIPIMFRNGLLAGAAFAEVGKLVRLHPGSIAIFILLRIALFIALAVVTTLTCCCCCFGAWPYIGTLIILPVLVYIKCFTLDFLAQFGPEYDVWTVDVPAPAAPIIDPNPLPPLG